MARDLVRSSSTLLAAAAVVLAGLLSGACVVQQAPAPPVTTNKSSAVTPIVIAHRGASGYRPEHTLAAYALAIEQGADYVEPDLVITADGVLVARHENEIGGTTNVASHPEFAGRRTTKSIDGREITGWFTEDFTLKELKTLRARERIPQLRAGNAQFDDQFEVPTFDEVIALVHAHNMQAATAARRSGVPPPRPVGLYPETKHPGYFRKLGKPLEEPLMAALERAGLDGEQSPVFIQSFETSNLRMLKGRTRVRLIQLLDDRGAPFDLVATGSAITDADLVRPEGLREIASYAYGIGAAKELVIPRNQGGLLGKMTSLVRNAHEHGLKVHAWTFRRENAFLPTNLRSGEAPGDSGALDQEIDAYLKAGIDGVFSDNPDIAVRVRDRSGNR